MDGRVHTLGYSNPTLEITGVDGHQRNPESIPQKHSCCSSLKQMILIENFQCFIASAMK